MWHPIRHRVERSLFDAPHTRGPAHAVRMPLRYLYALVRDLADDPSDYETLADTINLYSRRQIPLSVVALDPTPEDSEFFGKLLDNPGAISNVSLPTQAGGRGKLTVRAGFPVATAVLAVVAIGLLALSLHLMEPLRWRRRML